TRYFTLPFVPTNALSVSGDWTFLRFGENELSFHANYSYEDAVYTIATAGPAVLGRDLHASEPLERVDLRLTWATQLINDRRARLSFFANNVFDNRAAQFTIAGGSPLTGYVRQAAPYSEPRVLGIEANIEF
ncbi:MAG: TonB-dependent receptor, partial [Candidatus Hydrogenedentes bacterium]|nr:TonB-dependent receptor [Candidatus Hydrogenedentota bacterium]